MGSIGQKCAFRLIHAAYGAAPDVSLALEVISYANYEMTFLKLLLGELTLYGKPC